MITWLVLMHTDNELTIILWSILRCTSHGLALEAFIDIYIFNVRSLAILFFFVDVWISCNTITKICNTWNEMKKEIFHTIRLVGCVAIYILYVKMSTERKNNEKSDFILVFTPIKREIRCRIPKCDAFWFSGKASPSYISRVKKTVLTGRFTFCRQYPNFQKYVVQLVVPATVGKHVMVEQ